jgi:hypothetical protein
MFRSAQYCATDNESFDGAYENAKEYIYILQQDLERLMELPRSTTRIADVKTCLMRFEQVYSQFPHRNNLGLVETFDTYNMSVYPDLYHNSDQPIYDIGAMEKYANQLDDNLNLDSDLFLKIKNIHGDELADLYNEIERLNYLPKNSYTNKALYEVYLKTFEVLARYPSIEDLNLLLGEGFLG